MVYIHEICCVQSFCCTPPFAVFNQFAALYHSNVVYGLYTRDLLRSVILLYSAIRCVQSVCCTLPIKRRIWYIYTRFAAFSHFAVLRHSLCSISLLHSTNQTSYMVYIHEICCVQSFCCTPPFAVFNQFAALYQSNVVYGIYTRDLLRSDILLYSAIRCVQSVCCTLPIKRRIWYIYTRFAAFSHFAVLRHSLCSISLLHSTNQTSYMVYIHEICCVQSFCCTPPFAVFNQFAALYQSNVVYGIYTRDLLRSVILLYSAIRCVQTSYMVYIHEICCVQSFCCTPPFAVFNQFAALYHSVMMMSWCLMSSDVSWHIRDKLWPMPKHGSINLYVHGN